MFSPVNDKERIGWQLRATSVLLDLLTYAYGNGLPPVAWTVATAGAGLHGQVTVGTTAERRAAFEAWAALVGAEVHPERVESEATYLRATAKSYQRVRVAIAATLIGEEPPGHDACIRVGLHNCSGKWKNHDRVTATLTGEAPPL